MRMRRKATGELLDVVATVREHHRDGSELVSIWCRALGAEPGAELQHFEADELEEADS